LGGNVQRYQAGKNKEKMGEVGYGVESFEVWRTGRGAGD